ncbi:hypothetical protein ACFLUG_00985 [Chloroflexota bacterium]
MDLGTMLVITIVITLAILIAWSAGKGIRSIFTDEEEEDDDDDDEK